MARVHCSSVKRRDSRQYSRTQAPHPGVPEDGHDEQGLEPEALRPSLRHERVVRGIGDFEGGALLHDFGEERHISEPSRAEGSEGPPLAPVGALVGELGRDRDNPGGFVPEEHRTPVHAAGLGKPPGHEDGLTPQVEGRAERNCHVEPGFELAGRADLRL